MSSSSPELFHESAQDKEIIMHDLSGVIDDQSKRLCRNCATHVRILDRPDRITSKDKESIKCEVLVGEFRRSVGAGCLICRGLWQNIRKDGLVSFIETKSFYELTFSFNNWSVTGTRYTSGANSAILYASVLVDQTWIGRMFQVHTSTEPFCMDADIDISPPMTVIKRWLLQCADSHSSCCTVSCNAEKWYPTRLLHVETSEASNDVRLIMTEDNSLPSKEQYTTLSHCWGTKQPLRLLTSNIDHMTRGIALADLPKTFRHAIQVTKQLGIQYLWIDSLCIIQDDHDDWLNESMAMQNVYANGFCNIAATAAHDSSEGLFFDRNVQFLQPCFVDLPWMDTTGMQCELLDDEFWRESITDAPLNQRAWVCQERLLARRVIHFGKDQLFFECRETHLAEIYPSDKRLQSGVWDSYFKDMDPIIPQPRVQTRLLDIERDEKFWVYDKWQAIVASYSSGKLSQPSDKLIALSGIAERFRTVINDHYIAGMWERYLASQLLWETDEMCGVRPPCYRAPSFSWASLDGRIASPEVSDEHIVARILDVSIEKLNDGKMTGGVKGGYINISGFLANVTLSSPSWTYLVSVNSINGMPTLENQDSTFFVHLDVSTEDVSVPMVALVIQLNDVENGDAGVDRPRQGCFMDTIILKHIPGAFGHYIRVGKAWDNDEARMAMVQDIHKHPIAPCESYDPETGHHTIRIY